MQFKNSLPLPVLIIGGAVAGYVVTWVMLTLLNNLAFIIGPILGALWGLSLYNRRPRV